MFHISKSFILTFLYHVNMTVIRVNYLHFNLLTLKKINLRKFKIILKQSNGSFCFKYHCFCCICMIKDILISDPAVPIEEQIHINVIHTLVNGETVEKLFTISIFFQINAHNVQVLKFLLIVFFYAPWAIVYDEDTSTQLFTRCFTVRLLLNMYLLTYR